MGIFHESSRVRKAQNRLSNEWPVRRENSFLWPLGLKHRCLPPSFLPSAQQLPSRTHPQTPHNHHKWLAQSKPPANPQEVRLLASNSPPRQPGRPQRPPPVASRSPTDSARVPSLCVRLGVTRSRLSCSSASSPSNASFVKSPRTSRPTCASSPRPSWLSRRPLRLTSCRSSKTLTLQLSMPSVSPFNPRISRWPGASAASGLKRVPSRAIDISSPSPSLPSFLQLSSLLSNYICSRRYTLLLVCLSSPLLLSIVSAPACALHVQIRRVAAHVVLPPYP